LQDQRKLLEFLALKASIVAARRAAPALQTVTGTAINDGHLTEGIADNH
jgi:hypothetical protein